MKSKYFKIFISVVLIVSLCLAIYTTSANAIEAPIVIGGVGLAIGGIAWAIANAMGVDFSLQNYTAQQVETFIDPYYNVQTALLTSDFTFIKALRTGYDALKLSLTAYEALKAGPENVIVDNNIPDDTSGSIASYKTDGMGNKLGRVGNLAPIYPNVGDTARVDAGYYALDITCVRNNGTYRLQLYIDGVLVQTVEQYGNPGGQWTTWFLNLGEHPSQHTVSVTAGYLPGGMVMAYQTNIPVASNPALPYVSETVDTTFADDAEDNVTIVFPSQGTLTPTSSLSDIVDSINALAAANNSDVTVEIDVEPAPTPTPLPTDSLGDIPFDTFMEYYGESVLEQIDDQTVVIDTFGQSALEKLEEQTEILDTIGQNLEDQTDIIDTAGQSVVTAVEEQTDVIDTVGQDVVDAVESVDTNIQAGNGILSGIRSLIGSAVNTLEDIGEMVGELVQDIVLGTETLISGILNQIPSLFSVILSPIKTAASIWHYVVEWIQSIAGPFQFIWSMANGTSYYIVLPVYASLAAAVVLAFYKRFGK